jgi:hypothetical protein
VRICGVEFEDVYKLGIKTRTGLDSYSLPFVKHGLVHGPYSKCDYSAISPFVCW